MFEKIKNYIDKNTGFLLRLDDIAENMKWDFMNKAEIIFDQYNIKPVLGVIPYNKDKELLEHPKINSNFWDKVRSWQNKGWEIGMHGTYHSYKNICNKNDYLGYGGNTEFCNISYDEQLKKIKDGLNKFSKEDISIKTFFAPNHTFDTNTLKALKSCGINKVLDGYGLMPYEEDGIKFVPQLFYKIIRIPFGIQSFQIHLNYYNLKDFENFISFIHDNNKKMITFDQAITKTNNDFAYKVIRFATKKLLQLKRIFI
jgi:predicted deacetylase|tara:strand:- start:57 stop:824 length:768 start_codon:yes stop_codon:yes gene_type:complete